MVVVTPMTLMMIPASIPVPLIITTASAIIARTAAQHRSCSATDPSPDHLAIVTTKFPTYGGTTEPAHCATQGRLILLTATGGGRAPDGPTNGGTGQASGTSAYLFTEYGPGHTTHTATNRRVKTLTRPDWCASQGPHQQPHPPNLTITTHLATLLAHLR